MSASGLGGDSGMTRKVSMAMLRWARKLEWHTRWPIDMYVAINMSDLHDIVSCAVRVTLFHCGSVHMRIERGRLNSNGLGPINQD